jgi:hypothetical protein
MYNLNLHVKGNVKILIVKRLNLPLFFFFLSAQIFKASDNLTV